MSAVPLGFAVVGSRRRHAPSTTVRAHRYRRQLQCSAESRLQLGYAPPRSGASGSTGSVECRQITASLRLQSLSVIREDSSRT